MKKITFDSRGKIKIPALETGDKNIFEEYKGAHSQEPQYQILYASRNISNAVHVSAESVNHGFYEVRLHRIEELNSIE